MIKAYLVFVTTDNLVGQYIGHTAAKTKEVEKNVIGGTLVVAGTYYLYCLENDRDYGQEAIEILLQVMENNRDYLALILTRYKAKMETSAKVILNFVLA